MNYCNVCVHTNDKKYNIHDLPESDFSSLNIGTHKLSSNLEALNNQVWDENEKVYWQLDSEYKWLTEKEQIKIIKLAFLETSLTTKLVIQQKRRQSGDAHIRINWLGKKDEKYFKSDSTLAFGYGPGRGLGGDVTMNADNLWLLRNTPLTMQEAYDKGYIDNFNRAYPNTTKKFYDPIHTMKHEAGGHACGMRHLTNLNLKNSAIMYPYYNGKRVFSKEDLDYLFRLYTKMGYWERAVAIATRKMGFYQ